MELTVDPAAEWKQMFADAYRFERDFFYDPNMHGVNWAATRERYQKLLDAAVTRWDVNFVLGEFIAELNSSHTYRGGGDQEEAPSRGVGMLGVDWELAGGAYRIKHIVSGGAWDVDVRSPLAEPGLGVKEGDYVLAVNGIPLDTGKDPWAAFAGMADRDRAADGEQHGVDERLEAGGGEVPLERSRAAIPGVDRAAPRARREGHRRQGGVCLRAEHRRRRAERARAPVHGAVEQAGADRGRALQQRRPDPRSLHRAAESPCPQLLGRPRRAAAAMAARSAIAGRR